jgi:hypothetical protein
LWKGSLYKGLAAPQIGIQKRLIVCGLYGEIKILINPEILEQSGTFSNREYCMSLPRYDRKTIKRSQNVTGCTCEELLHMFGGFRFKKRKVSTGIQIDYRIG